LIDFNNVCIIRNRNEYSTQQIEIISLQPYYVSTLPNKTKNSTKTADRLLQHSDEPIFPKFYRKSFNVRFSCICLNIPLAVFQQTLLHSRWFYRKKYLQTQYG